MSPRYRWVIRDTMLVMFATRLASISILVAVLNCIAATAQAATIQLRYTVLMNGKAAGSEVDTYREDGYIDSQFEFNDRGRGPKITAHYRISPAGLPLSPEITGNDYLKAPVDEHFRIEQGVGRWKSTSESGQVSRPGFYVSNNGPAVEVALLVNALSKAGKTPVDLLPSRPGEAGAIDRCDRRESRSKIAYHREPSESPALSKSGALA